MKKGGILSLIVYILYTLGGLGLIIYSRVSIDKHNAEGGGLEGIGLALLLVLGIILGAAGLLATILKLIHMKSGWGLFGLLCILADVAFIFAWVSMAAPGGNINQIAVNDILPSIPFILASLASMIANIKSLKD